MKDDNTHLEVEMIKKELEIVKREKLSNREANVLRAENNKLLKQVTTLEKNLLPQTRPRHSVTYKGISVTKTVE